MKGKKTVSSWQQEKKLRSTNRDQPSLKGCDPRGKKETGGFGPRDEYKRGKHWVPSKKTGKWEKRKGKKHDQGGKQMKTKGNNPVFVRGFLLLGVGLPGGGEKKKGIGGKPWKRRQMKKRRKKRTGGQLVRGTCGGGKNQKRAKKKKEPNTEKKCKWQKKKNRQKDKKGVELLNLFESKISPGEFQRKSAKNGRKKRSVGGKKDNETNNKDCG